MTRAQRALQRTTANLAAELFVFSLAHRAACSGCDRATDGRCRTLRLVDDLVEQLHEPAPPWRVLRKRRRQHV